MKVSKEEAKNIFSPKKSERMFVVNGCPMTAAEYRESYARD